MGVPSVARPGLAAAEILPRHCIRYHPEVPNRSGPKDLSVQSQRTLYPVRLDPSASTHVNQRPGLSASSAICFSEFSESCDLTALSDNG